MPAGTARAERTLTAPRQAHSAEKFCSRGCLTQCSGATDNSQVVLSRMLPRIAALLGVAGVLGLAVLPTEHRHRALAHASHHSDTIHRHFESHHPIGSDAGVDRAAAANDDGTIQWITVSLAGPEPSAQVLPDSQFYADPLPVSPPQPIVRRTSQPLHTSVHDPPWAKSVGLRAPPALLI
jgi:hypothetical protein